MNELIVHVYKLTSPEDARHSYCCMDEATTPWPESLCLCRNWIKENLGVHVEGYHLLLENGEVIGHIYYADSQDALFPYQVEDNVCILYCEWVQRRFQRHGFGKMLFSALHEELMQVGAKGILVEATEMENLMYYGGYLKRGFKNLGDSGHRKLMYFPITRDQVEVKPLQSTLKAINSVPIEIVLINGYLCPYEVSTQLLLREIVKEFSDRVQLQEVWLSPKILEKYGSSRGIFINGQQKLVGGESEQEIRQAILEEL